MTINGLTLRAGRGEEDAELAVGILEACRDADGLDPGSVTEELPTRDEMIASLRNFPPENMLAAEAKGEAIGYACVKWWVEEDGLWLYLHVGRVLPSWRGRGIGTTFVHWAEDRIRRLAIEHPTGGKATFGANASSTEHQATALLLNECYQVAWTGAQMDFDDFDHLPQVQMPAGFEVRVVTPAAYSAMLQAERDTWRGIGYGQPAPGDDQYDELAEAAARDGHLWQVAWAGDEVAGQVWCHVDNYGQGIIDEVNVRKAYRRRGLASALMAASIQALRQQGVFRIRLATDDDNKQGAKSLYEKLGFRTTKRFPRYHKPLTRQVFR